MNSDEDTRYFWITDAWFPIGDVTHELGKISPIG